MTCLIIIGYFYFRINMEKFLEAYKKVVDRATIDSILTRLHDKIDIEKCSFLDYIYRDTLKYLSSNLENIMNLIRCISVEILMISGNGEIDLRS